MNNFLPFRVSLVAPVLLASVLALPTTGCEVTTEGADDHATFAYTSLGPLSAPLAAGASDSLTISIQTSAVADHATSSDPSVLSLGSLSAGGAGAYTLPINGVKPGSVTVTIYDASNKEIDHTTLQVADTASITLDATSGTTLLAGESFVIHGTTLGQQGGTLAGSGAISFAFQGALAAGSSGFTFCDGDCGYFQASAPGDGQVSASAPGTTASVALHVVPLSAIDGLTVGSATLMVARGASATTSYALTAAGTTVHSDGSEITCTSSNPAIATAGSTSTADLQGDKSTYVQVTGVAIGAATVTCTVGSRQASLSIIVK